jgi:hypothetical protein
MGLLSRLTVRVGSGDESLVECVQAVVIIAHDETFPPQWLGLPQSGAVHGRISL